MLPDEFLLPTLKTLGMKGLLFSWPTVVDDTLKLAPEPFCWLKLLLMTPAEPLVRWLDADPILIIVDLNSKLMKPVSRINLDR